MKKNTQKTSWGSVAAWYDTLLQGNDTYQKELILPHLLRLIKPKKGNTILDSACGQGFFSFALAEKGATVVGVDIAPELIARAKMHATQHTTTTTFITAPAEKTPLPEQSCTAAISILALQNIEAYKEALAEIARVLQPHGTLVIVLNHPAFRIPVASSWEFDSEKNIQYRRIERYALPFSTQIDMTPGTQEATKKKYTVSFHRPLQEYAKALTKVGFLISGIEEWHSHRESEKGPRQKAEDAARKEFPLFLMLRAEKR